MNKNVIARVRLNAGQIGYFDDLTQLYLSHQSPVADVIAGMNCTTLVNAVKAGKISVIEGTITQNSKVKKLFKMPQITVAADNKPQQTTAEKHTIKEDEHSKKEAAAKQTSAEIQKESTATKNSPAVKPEDISLKKGEVHAIAGFENATFSSSDAAVASVTKKGGKVTAKSAGKAVITVSGSDQDDVAFTVTVASDEPAADTTKDSAEKK